ncbi:MAG: phosphoribosylglycinamide formyltransferase [Synergistaceae bacterium]|nr:phosphoribosylglycinamide formyltransferase [Synergistaceae bacterium]
MLKIAVLVSGGGTNLQALIDAQNNGVLSSGKIAHVISSREDAYALKRAEEAGIPSAVAKNEDEILPVLAEVRPDIIVLAGYMKILSAEFIDTVKVPIVNVHPSLIPSFCGKGYYGLKVHEVVLKAGVKVTGATVHYVNEIPDGGEIIAQKAVDVLPNDTPEVLQRRVMEQAEWVLLPQSVEEVCRKMKPHVFPEPHKYAGRGIIVGMTPSGGKMLAYFIMGRSATSKARRFERSGNNLVIKLTKEDKDFDPSLILYTPLKILDDSVIVTNGDQTDIIYNALRYGGTFEGALRTRTYEPDAPHYTPRISAIMTPSGYRQSILKRDGRYFYEYDYIPGKGRLIHTYNHDVKPGEVLPSFTGEPREVNIIDDVEEFAGTLWSDLGEDYRVALYVRYYDGENFRDKLYNTQEAN